MLRYFFICFRMKTSARTRVCVCVCCVDFFPLVCFSYVCVWFVTFTKSRQCEFKPVEKKSEIHL